MPCEMCGASGNLKNVLIDGVEMKACENCSQYGKVIVEEKPAVSRSSGSSSARRKSYTPQTSSIRKIKDKHARIIASYNYELIDDYGLEIRKAREKKKLTIEELAKKIFEKESILRRVENNSLEPNKKMIDKLQRFLGVSLLEQEDDDDDEDEGYKRKTHEKKKTIEDVSLESFGNIRIKKKWD